MRLSAYGELHLDVAQSHNSIGCLQQDLGNYAASEFHLLRAIELREQLLGAHHPDVAMSVLNLGGLRSAQARLDDAEREFQRALSIYRAAFGEMHSGVAQWCAVLFFLI